MEFKTTFIKARKRAFTLVELMIGTGIATMAMGILAVTTSMMLTSFDSMSNYIELEQQSRHSLDLMSREIRSASRLIGKQPEYVMLEVDDGTPVVKWFLYYHNASDRKLRRYVYEHNTSTSSTVFKSQEVLLDHVDRLTFSIFQRNPIGGSYDQYPAASASTCKLIQLNWTCTLENFVGTQNTELVQSAKFVIRKQ